MTTNMSNPSATFLGNIDKNVDAYKNNPQALQKEVQQDAKKPLIQQKLQKLIALEILSNDYKAAENQVALLSDPLTDTVYGQKAKEVFGLKATDVARRVAAVEQNKAVEQRKRLEQLAGQGIPTAYSKAGGSVNKLNMGGLVGEYMRAPTTNAAHGGLVSFDNGGGVRSWYGAETAEREKREETMQDYLWDLGAEGFEDFLEFAGENWETIILGAPFLGEVLKRIPYGPSKVLGEALTSTKVPREIKKAFQKWKQARKGGKDSLASAREAAPAGALWAKGLGKPPTGHPFQNLISAGQTVKGIARKAWDKTIKPLTYGSLGWMAAGNWAAPGDDTTESNPQLDAMVAGMEARKAAQAAKLAADEEKIPTSLSPSQQLATNLQGELAGLTTKQTALQEGQDRYTTMRGNLLSARTTDSEREQDALNALIGLQQGQVESEERGIAGLKTAQGTAYGEHQDTINQLNTMAGKARGTDKDYLRDLIVGLGTVGQGRNLGQGLGDAGIAIAGRQDERAATARGIEKEALGEEVRLSESRLAGAKDIVDLENKAQQTIVNNKRDLNSQNREIRAAAQETQRGVLELEKLITAGKTEIAGIGIDRIKAYSSAILELAQLKLIDKEIEEGERAATNKAVEAVTLLLGEINTGMTELSEEQRNSLTTRATEILRDNLDQMTGIAP